MHDDPQRETLAGLLRDASELEVDPACRALIEQAQAIVAGRAVPSTIVVKASPSTQPEPAIVTLCMPEAVA
jgi:hypothetical protein